jgi:hypothetical protein
VFLGVSYLACQSVSQSPSYLATQPVSHNRHTIQVQTSFCTDREHLWKICWLSVWKYVDCQCENMSTVNVKICRLSVWKYVDCQCENMSTVSVKICRLSMWKYVDCQCENMSTVNVKICRLSVWKHRGFPTHEIDAWFTVRMEGDKRTWPWSNAWIFWLFIVWLIRLTVPTHSYTFTAKRLLNISGILFCHKINFMRQI